MGDGTADTDAGTAKAPTEKSGGREAQGNAGNVKGSWARRT